MEDMCCLRVVCEFLQRGDWSWGSLEVEIAVEGRGGRDESGVSVGYD